MLRVDDADRTVWCLVEDRHVDVPDLAPVIGAFTHRFSGAFGEWVADLMRRRGTSQPPLAVTVGGRPALAYDWTDGVADVYSTFVAVGAETGVEFECSSRPEVTPPRAVEELGTRILDTVHWLDRS